MSRKTSSSMSITSHVLPSPLSQTKKKVKHISKERLQNHPRRQLDAPRSDNFGRKQRRNSLSEMPAEAQPVEHKVHPHDEDSKGKIDPTRRLKTASRQRPVQKRLGASLHSLQNARRSPLRPRRRVGCQQDPVESSSLSLSVHNNPRNQFRRSNSVPTLSGRTETKAPKKICALYDELISMPSTIDFLDSSAVSNGKLGPDQKQCKVDLLLSHHSMQHTRRRKRSNSDVGLRLKWSSLHEPSGRCKSLGKGHKSYNLKNEPQSPPVVQGRLDSPESRNGKRYQECNDASQDSKRNQKSNDKKQHNMLRQRGDRASVRKQFDTDNKQSLPRRLPRAESAPPVLRKPSLFDQAFSPVKSRRRTTDRQISDRRFKVNHPVEQTLKHNSVSRPRPARGALAGQAFEQRFQTAEESSQV
mmetsp:Transcript_8969/g.17151  ORF Transcript_8969/g.17151 Transcript_8969/m.17151 type:complete len:414 (+) Transcript_8969:1-1242(+)